MKTYTLTIFTGAFLLFQVQPLIARFILPWFGGSPSVWTACMLFFQVFLLAGYAYAHASTRWLRPKQQALLHLLLVAGALLFIPIIPNAQWKPGPEDNPVWRILLLLAATIGLPYMVLAGTSPLLQKWFHLTLPGRSPYRLYAVSNTGSLLALLSYPFVFEPVFTRRMQAHLWSAGLFVYALLVVVCAFHLRRKGVLEADKSEPSTPAEKSRRPSAAVQALWVLLAACAVVILLGTTNRLCQNVAVVPFLWVLPLSLYLLTFILCFDRTAWYRRTAFMLMLLPLMVLLCRAAYRAGGLLLPQIALYCGGLFVCCMVCHGELYRLRPPPRDLTLFYLLIAAGGALGGMFAAVVAPLVFRTYAELNWSLCLLGVLLTFIHAREKSAWTLCRRRWSFWPVIAAGTVALALALFMQVRRAAADVVAMSRSFFGTLRIEEVCRDDPALHGYILAHGSIRHGAQFTDPVKAKMPITYFNAESGVGLAMNHLPRKANRRVGIVGLGAGTLAAYGRAGDVFRFYEIDPDVVRLGDQWFTYLKDSAARVEVVLGDGRLSLESEPDQQYDLLVLDAFSGDAPPVHLLTLEAFGTYLRHLKPDGVIAVNISNLHLDFFPVMRGVIEHFGLGMGMFPWREDPMPPGVYSSKWILMTRNRAFLTSPPIAARARAPSDPKSATPIFWTDEYASLFKIITR